MKSSYRLWLLFVLFLIVSPAASAQVDSLVGQITSDNALVYVTGISGDGRFVLIESNGNLATEKTATRNNADNNFEVFLFDYAQRRIFQITNTKRVLKNTANSPVLQDNICVDIVNARPALSNDGRWIAFSSNATTSVAGTAPNGTNPGNFDGNSFTTGTPPNTTCPTNPLTADANTEMWLYQIPATTAIDLSSGVEAPLTDLSAGTFQQITNSVASRTPVEGTTTFPPVVADDNRDATVNDDGTLAAFTSTRDYTGQNPEATNQDNPEIFSFSRASASIKQVTVTPRGSALQPVFNSNPSLSGTGARLAFFSNTNVAPFAGTATFVNEDGNGEVFYANLDATGAAIGGKQVTNTIRVNPGDVANLYSPGRRISRDGNFIAFETFSSDPTNRGGLVSGLGLYVFNAAAATDAYRQIGPRGDADAGASGGDIRRVPVFSIDDTDLANPRTVVVFASRLNIRQTDGTIPTTASDGQNPDENRPVQIYFAPLAPTAPGTVIPVTRVSKLPNFSVTLADTAPIASNTFRRIAFALARTEIGTGNFDLSPEAFYLLAPRGANTAATGEQLSVTTGASALPVVVGSPSPTPTPTPTPSPSPTPTTPAIVTGVSPGMLINLNLAATSGIPVFTAQTATGVSTARSFAAPIQLGGVSVSINNAAAQLLSLNNRQIVLVVPPGLQIGKLPLIVNANGTIFRSTIDIVATRPDIFRSDGVIAPLGRARIFNATNRVLQPEPFSVTSIRLRGGGRRQTRVRLFLTGVQFVPAAVLSIRVGNQTISGASILTAATDTTQPGVQTIDFLLPAALNGAGDVPIVVTVTAGSNTFSSRLEDTAPRVRIL